ncbi:MAG: NAD-dependent epimerase/dehydratase family protein [Alphaproteobacteria bacterium]|nr:NAD-dependent epimerase/dehydratase family protein [Alphaproteobacteria bacterium]
MTSQNARTAFVTGGTGFVGINIVDTLLAAGWTVTALHRAGANVDELSARGVTLAEGDITNPASLARAIPKGVDAVFHVAASMNMWSRRNAEQHAINVGGTRNVVEAALAAGARKLIHTSSISVYGIQKGRIDESAEQLGRVSWLGYQRTKFLAEEEVRAGIGRGLPATILNPCNIIGAHDRTGWARLIRMIAEDTLPGVPPGSNSFAHVGEVAKAHVAAVDKGVVGENYLLGGIDDSYLNMVQIIGRLLDRKVPTKPIVPWKLRLLGRFAAGVAAVTGKEPRITPESAALASRYLFADSSKAERVLGHKTVPLEDMLRESIDWLRANGLIDA